MARNPNEGYTDPNFDYVPLEGELLDGRYKVLQVLGKGSFGVVIKAIDVQTDDYVAIKIIKAKKSFSKQAMIEIRILEFLNSNDPQDTKNLVRLKRYFQHREHLCLVYELLSHNLFDLLRCKKFSGLDLNLVRKFGFQILVALQFLQSPRIQVIHCDLKPENILLRQANKSSLKVIDFGSSCFVNERMYSYIQSRFYRSPEVILGRSYGTPIDMWSLGCVLVELFTGNPLFNGQNEHDQICRMCDVLGIPPSYVLELSSPQKLKTMFIKVSPMQWHLVPTPDFQPTGKTLQHILNEKQTKSLFSDLIRRMLHYDPLKRLSPLAALHHPFFQPMFDQASQTNLTQSTQPTQPSKAHKQHDLRPIGGLATTYRSNGEQS
ncbi:kinase-like domain-containing protein [Paraphysoderma sedebokerense]|nr:kinase-like domain-containing protein [Paraphysoderma sedebokerense]